MSMTNSRNLLSNSTGLTQHFCDLAISDDVLSSEDSNELLVVIIPIVTAGSKFYFETFKPDLVRLLFTCSILCLRKIFADY